ncbi:hypothetical protein niasHS_015398 [Heterodera schachtii]|uniref:B30.2/SPRY domain-containing protein n=2 Tax=Heterodera TaxID=34509 RepID=A0ABD2HZK2_HETSC
MFFYKKKTTQSKTNSDQQKMWEQKFKEGQAKLTEAEAQNQKLKNDIEKMEAKFDGKVEQLEKNLEELQKNQKELMTEHNELKAKVDQIEQQEQQKHQQEDSSKTQTNDGLPSAKLGFNVWASRFPSTQYGKYRNPNNASHFSKSQNDQKEILENSSELEKQKKVLLNFRQNSWDEKACHEDLEISGDNSLTVYRKRTNLDSFRSVLAKHPFSLDYDEDSSGIFYFEITVLNRGLYGSAFFGFAKPSASLKELHNYSGTYGFESDGWVWINKSAKGPNAECSYGNGDTVGIGLNSATRQIIFTKNGLRLDSSDLFIPQTFAGGPVFFPFVSLWESGDKIEANFGPNFKFDLTTF